MGSGGWRCRGWWSEAATVAALLALLWQVVVMPAAVARPFAERIFLPDGPGVAALCGMDIAPADSGGVPPPGHRAMDFPCCSTGTVGPVLFAPAAIALPGRGLPAAIVRYDRIETVRRHQSPGSSGWPRAPPQG